MPHPRLFLLLLLAGLSTGCDNPVSPFERNNPKDPKSDLFKPERPTGLKLIVDEDAVVLQWLDHSAFEDGYLVEKTSATGEFAEIASLAPGTTTFRDTTSVSHASTSYRVHAFVGEPAERRITSTEAAKLDLGRILDFSIEPAEGGVRLLWHDDVRFEDGFIIGLLHQGRSTELAVVPPNSSEFADHSTPVSFSSDPTYSVRPFIRLGDDRVLIDSVFQDVSIKDAFAPADVRVSFRDEETTVVSWSDRSHFELGFLVELSLGGAEYHEVATLDANITSFEHHALLIPGLNYNYRVRAQGSSPGDNDASIFAWAPSHIFEISAPDAYLAPSNNAGSVNLSWEHEEPLTRGYVVERSELGRGPAVERARLPATARSYEDLDVRAGTTYEYHVRTLSSLGDIVRTTYARGLRDEHRLFGHSKPAFSLAFSPDGRYLASGSGYWFGESHVSVWDLETNRRVHELRHAGAVTSIAFSPDGRTLATGAQDGTDWVMTRLNLWDVPTGRLSRTFTEGFTFKVAFHPNGEIVGGIGDRGSIWFWDAASGRQAYHIDMNEEVGVRPLGLAFDSDGSHLITSGGYLAIILRDGFTGAEERRLRAFGDLNGFAFSPDDALLAAGHACSEGIDSGEVVLLNVASGAEVRRLPGCALGFSPDGALYASGNLRQSYARAIHFRTVSSGELYAVTDGWAAAFHPDGKRIAVALGDGSISIRSIAEAQWIEL